MVCGATAVRGNYGPTVDSPEGGQQLVERVLDGAGFGRISVHVRVEMVRADFRIGGAEFPCARVCRY
jgi:hypothetical protein